MQEQDITSSTNNSFDTNINIVGGLKDYSVIYKTIESYFSDNDSVKDLIISRNELTLRTERSRIRITRAINSSFLRFFNEKHKESGLIKLMHPDGVYTKEDVRDYLEIALEMRRRVKEQLKRVGGMEFWDTNFSYIDKETQEEIYVGLPEEKGSHLIESTPLPPGICYTSTSDGENLALVRIEVVTTLGSGKLNITGINNNTVKENIKNTSARRCCWKSAGRGSPE